MMLYTGNYKATRSHTNNLFLYTQLVILLIQLVILYRQCVYHDTICHSIHTTCIPYTPLAIIYYQQFIFRVSI